MRTAQTLSIRANASASPTWLYLFPDADDCDDEDAQQFYDATDENVKISPDFAWYSYAIDC
ncbi:hypothetical protein LTR36_004120 [Oleoguttula mirabilis]|uniref:Uncharacterized protein n=1 Tax=Oleoguttula mirabilis TaxID=1507867 RepID=A0AAV9JH81_9PEZI|nr:hypothetical protein LTR36_004120 [Oleoguttula mirabilis]